MVKRIKKGNILALNILETQYFGAKLMMESLAKTGESDYNLIANYCMTHGKYIFRAASIGLNALTPVMVHEEFSRIAYFYNLYSKK